MRRFPILTAADIARVLGGRRTGPASYLARCPAHDDRTPSLSLKDAADGADGRILLFCHAGCDYRDVVAALRERGLWPSRRSSSVVGPRLQRKPRKARKDDRPDRNRAMAMQIWAEARPAEGTPVERYLRSRGIRTPVPAALRFHEQLRHGPSSSMWPAMVGLLTHALSNEPLAVHRTFLTPDGSKAPVTPTKMLLGAASGGVIRLGEPADELLLAEGIETALSGQQACGIAAWSAISSSGLRSLSLPQHITQVTIMADGDEAGEQAAMAAARNLKSAVRSVRVVRVPSGLDANDLLNLRVSEEPDHD